MFESLRTANLVVLVSIIVLFANDYFSSDHRFSTALSAHLDGRDQTREQIQSYQLLGTSIENLVGKNDTQSHETIISPPPPASGGIGLRQDVEAPSDATEHAGNTSILGTAGGPSDGKPGRLSVHETALSSWESSSVSSDRSSTDNNNNNSNHLISSGNTLGNSTIFSETSPTSKPHHDLSKHSANTLAPTISLDHPPGFRRNQDEARAAERGTDHHYHHHRIASVALNNRANHQVVVVGSSGGDGRSISSSISSGSGSSHELLKRHAASMAQELNPDCEFQISRKPAIYGIRCDDSEVTEDGSIIIEAFKATRVYLIGRNLYSNLTVAITGQEGATQDDCTHADRIKSLRLYNLSLNIGEIIIELPPPEKSVPYYLCIREDTHDSRWYHQGSDPWLRIHVQQDFMPLWAKIITIIILLSMSGLFSGLNLGLMALDKNELQVIMKCGTEDEKHYATVIEPVRRRGNYLLCSILFSNTLVNSTISVFLEDLSDGLVAIMTSTILIVLFGEILPQAFCSRHGLAVGAKTIWLTHACMFLTFPLSYPVSYCLDWALGEEIGHAYDRERLMEFIQVTRDINNLEADEVNIISGALKIKRVQISEVMTRIEDVYMLDETALLDFDTIQAIVSKGYSRIPVHEAGNRRNIKAVLFAKDLALVDPDDRTPVKTMISFYNHPRMFVFEDTTLDKALNEFKTGKSHMAIVQRVIDDGDRDPYYEVTGIVTLEDVIEEIMQMEINDETDTLTDNRRKRRRKDAQVRKDFSQFTDLGMGDSSFNVVTPQLCLAAYQYLATSVEPFTPKYLSDSVLRRLLSQKIFYKVRLDDKESAKRLYTVGEPADYFIMILEGRVSVRCGKENLVFEGGPFSHYGTAALYNCDQLGESLAVSTSNPATTAPVTPGGSTGIVAQALAAATGSITGATARKDSVRPMLSRRESMAKIITSQLSLAPKKSGAAAAEQDQAAISGDLSPTGSARITSGADAGTGGVMETVELVERGSFYFKPDYTVDIITNTSYLKVTRNDYITALKATWVEREGAALLGEDVETTFTDLGPSCMYFEKQ